MIAANDEQEKTLQETAGGLRQHSIRGYGDPGGFKLARTKGSHHIFIHPDLPELLNLQNNKGKAKPYQIRQFMTLVEDFNLDLGEES